ncbi:DUF1153 domain-containing protein [Pelagibacterium sp.]|uniref:DUF1153 domain-containing protein n=1 Tax=Pelagibacterium sp. TaxID=1967288 RepID=UPI003A940043
MDDSIKRWTAKRKTALVIEIIQGKTTVSEASRSFDLTPSEIESLVEDAKRGMENSLRANLLDIREQYEKQLRDLQEAYGGAMLELLARKSFRPCWMRRTGIDPLHPAGPLGGGRCGVDRQALHVVRHSPANGLLQAGESRAEGRYPLL